MEYLSNKIFLFLKYIGMLKKFTNIGAVIIAIDVLLLKFYFLERARVMRGYPPIGISDFYEEHPS